MHSSKLRGTDFTLTSGGASVAHAEFFAGFQRTRRVGVLSPRPLDGLGATALILAYVTAFYDDYRATGQEFFAYPDFFTFQRAPQTARYGMLDVWPDRKNVGIGPAATHAVDALTDRAVDVLLVPEGAFRDAELHPVQAAALQRQVRDCYLYHPLGQVEAADLTVSCPRDPVADWVRKVEDSVPGLARAPHDHGDDSRLQQSFRRLSLDDALGYL